MNKVISSSVHIETDKANSTIPVTSPFLWFSGPRNGVPKSSSNLIDVSQVPIYKEPDEAGREINRTMSFNKQLVRLSVCNEIPESHTRVRFLLCRQIEIILQVKIIVSKGFYVYNSTHTNQSKKLD